MSSSIRQVVSGIIRSISLAAVLVLGAAWPAEALRARCAWVTMWTDANGCYHERWRYEDCESHDWLGTVEVIYC
jgi:hypothetical protein